MTLTEQWKQGKLNRNKVYYYETPFNTVDTASGYWLCNHLDTEKDKVEILGEVPSYEKYISLVNWKEDLTELCTAKERIIEKYENIDTWWKANYTELKEENAQLKELLKTHKLLFELEKDNAKDVFQQGKYAYLINEIDRVLADNKIQANTVACNKIQENE